jgi:hypothetical protein
MRKIEIILLLLFSFSSHSWAQSLTVRTSQQDILIGDQVRILVTLEKAGACKVDFPVYATVWKDQKYEIFNVSEQKKSANDSYEQEVVLIPWDTGKIILPSLQVFCNDSLISKPLILEVDLPKGISGDSNYLAPIKNVLSEEKNFYDYLLEYKWYLLAILLAGFVIVFIWLYKKKWMEWKEKRKWLTPEQRALQAVDLLLSKQFIQKGMQASYYGEISWILRTYLNERFSIKALEGTRAEIFSQIDIEQMHEPMKLELDHWLEICDLVKFAKASAMPEEHQKSVLFIKKLIETTLERLKESDPS